jgi:hypothetical protein
MSAKLSLAAAAALLTVLSVQGPASAQAEHKSTHHHSKAQLPADAYGSATPARVRPSNGLGYGGTSVDPDPRIQFELNRDRGSEGASGGGGNG